MKSWWFPRNLSGNVGKICLRQVSEVLEAWLTVQRNWLYLQPIFESPDINKQVARALKLP